MRLGSIDHYQGCSSDDGILTRPSHKDGFCDDDSGDGHVQQREELPRDEAQGGHDDGEGS